jgi:hypothetical protein
MTGFHVYRRNSDDIASVMMGQGRGADRPSDGRIKAARCAAVGRLERGQ